MSFSARSPRDQIFQTRYHLSLNMIKYLVVLIVAVECKYMLVNDLRNLHVLKTRAVEFLTIC